jgi:ABC-type transport system substrate-binding protein
MLRSTRREFLEGAALLGAGAFALAACGGSSSPTSGFNKNAQLRFAMSTTIPGLDPQKWWNGAAGCGQNALFETLLIIDPYTQKLLPSLASSFPKVTNSGTRYTFQLRPGIKFSNGQPLTAEDVKFSFERLVIPSFASQAGSLYTPLPIKGMADVLNQKAKTLSGITTPDARTIVFDLDAPDSAFIYLTGFNSAGVVPKALVESLGFNHFNWNPIGTGPFTANVVNQQSHIILRRNPHYWQPGMPRYAGVDWSMGIDEGLSMIRIEAGQLDMMYEAVPSGYTASVLGNPKYKSDHQIVETRQNNAYSLSISQTTSPALKDFRVRQAIAMAIDKKRLLQVTNGLGRVADGGIFSPLSPYFQRGLAYQYDPAAARALVAQAGFTNATVKMFAANIFPYPVISQVIQADLGKIGINVALDVMQYSAAASLPIPYPGLSVGAWELAYPSGSYIVDSAFTAGALKAGCCNAQGWSSPSFDALTVEAHRSTDPSQVVALYKEMDHIVTRQEILWVPLIYPTRLDFVSRSVRDFQASVNFGADQSRYFYKYAVA